MNTPTQPGFYWAKSGTSKWFNLLVECRGEPPFMWIVAYDRCSHPRRVFVLDPDDVTEWGLRILAPDEKPKPLEVEG